MDAIAAVDPEIAAAAFLSEHAIALGGRPAPSWVRRGRLAPGSRRTRTPGRSVQTSVVMYDPERWRHTPAEEQRDPIGAMARFGDVARRHGYVCMITPHPGLLSIPGRTLSRDAHEIEEAAYERSRISEAAARAADIVETQAQRLQNRPDAYPAHRGRPMEAVRLSFPSLGPGRNETRSGADRVSSYRQEVGSPALTT
jgi:hypothetical protein